MADASNLQTSFLGGEWSPYMQGRADREDYKFAMNLCLNGMPIEEGSWVRRPGTLQAGVTRHGVPGVLREFYFEQAHPYSMELTDGHLRFWAGAALVTEDPRQVISFTSSYEAILDEIPAWNIGDQVQFKLLGDPTGSYGDVAPLLGGKQFDIGQDTIGETTLTRTVYVYDSLFNTDLSSVVLGTNDMTVSRIVDFPTPYFNGEWADVRAVQDDTDVLLMHMNHVPQVLSVVTTEEDSATGFAEFSYSTATFLDGPYLDAPTDGSTLTPGSTSGTVQFVVSALGSVNNGAGFVDTDIGRLMRFYSEPALWASGTTYAKGDNVKYDDEYYQATAASTGVEPDTDNSTHWVINPSGAKWTWGTINQIVAPDTVNVALAAADPDGVKAGGDLLYTVPLTAWRMGRYSDTTGWPTGGTFHEGRLWLFGQTGNHFDCGVSNDTFNMMPTLLDGTVSDDCGISATFASTDISTIFWMIPDHQGIVCGTQAGEWVIQASNLNDPITPTSIQAHRVTRFGCENIEPRRTGMSLTFVRRYGQKIMEYISDVYSGKYSGTNISLTGSHLLLPGVAEIAYQQELTPVVWARLKDGTLAAMTYRRDSPFGTQAASFAGWHHHTLGTGRTVLSIQGGPSVGGETDTLNLLTQDPATTICYVELLTDLFPSNGLLANAWYIDGGVNPAGVDIITGPPEVLRFYGLDAWIGQTVDVWAAGVDMGSFTISGTTLDVPYNGDGNLLSAAYLNSIVGDGFNFTAGLYASSPAADYVMTANENYPAKVVLDFNAASLVNIMTSQNALGLSYDHKRRKMMYTMVNIPVNPINTTPWTLWDGVSSVSPGGAISVSSDLVQRFALVIEKDVDTGEVIGYDTYNARNIVPSGISSSDGTWRRMVTDFSASGGSEPAIVNPHNNDLWVSAQSCNIYQFRKQDNFSLVISPLQPQGGGDNLVKLNGMTEDWAHATERKGGTLAHDSLYLIPAEITAAERAADSLLAYATYAYPTAADTAYYTTCVTHAKTMYVFSAQKTSTRDYKLYRFDPPSAFSYPTPPSDGGFTDITPWDSSHGPNTSPAGSYTADNSYSDVGAIQFQKFKSSIFYLPTNSGVSADMLVLLAKYLPADNGGSTDPADFSVGCTYYDIGGAAFEQHSTMVYGYMNSDWTVGDLSTAAYAVLDYREVNPYLGASDYVYGDAAYSTRWLFFECNPVTAGVVDTTQKHTVAVQYQFTYGSAPSVLRVIDENGWDVAYPAYASAISDANVVRASMSDASGDSLSQENTILDSAVYDHQTQSFWWSGLRKNMYQLDSRFSSRSQSGTPTICPPILKLSARHAPAYQVPLVLGHAFTSRGQLLRAISPQDAGAQNGPALGKTRRVHMGGVLLQNTQGISFGTVFGDLIPANLCGPDDDTPLAKTSMFSGVHWDAIENDYSYDSMFAWEITRPYPANVVSVEQFLHCQDR